MSRFSVGDRVRWGSSGVRKSGRVIKVVRPHARLTSGTDDGIRQAIKSEFPELWLEKYSVRKLSRSGAARDHTSYLVEVSNGIDQRNGEHRKPFLYWPRVEHLETA